MVRNALGLVSRSAKGVVFQLSPQTPQPTIYLKVEHLTLGPNLNTIGSQLATLKMYLLRTTV